MLDKKHSPPLGAGGWWLVVVVAGWLVGCLAGWLAGWLAGMGMVIGFDIQIMESVRAGQERPGMEKAWILIRIL